MTLPPLQGWCLHQWRLLESPLLQIVGIFWKWHVSIAVCHCIKLWWTHISAHSNTEGFFCYQCACHHYMVASRVLHHPLACHHYTAPSSSPHSSPSYGGKHCYKYQLSEIKAHIPSFGPHACTLARWGDQTPTLRLRTSGNYSLHYEPPCTRLHSAPTTEMLLTVENCPMDHKGCPLDIKLFPSYYTLPPHSSSY